MKRKWVLRGKRNRMDGDRFEQKVLNTVKSSALAACRSSGSKGLFDVYAVLKDKLRCIVAKTGGYLTIKERRQLTVFFKHKPSYAQVEVHFYKNSKRCTKRIIKNAAGIQPYYV